MNSKVQEMAHWGEIPQINEIKGLRWLTPSFRPTKFQTLTKHMANRDGPPDGLFESAAPAETGHGEISNEAANFQHCLAQKLAISHPIIATHWGFDHA